MKKDILIVVLVFLGIIIVALSFTIQTQPNKIDCNKPIDVIFLRPSEINEASEIANKINGVVVVPELNKIIGRSEILLCPNFEASDYINTGGLSK